MVNICRSHRGRTEPHGSRELTVKLDNNGPPSWELTELGEKQVSFKIKIKFMLEPNCSRVKCVRPQDKLAGAQTVVL